MAMVHCHVWFPCIRSHRIHGTPPYARVQTVSYKKVGNLCRCPYSDITLAVRRVRTASRGRVQRVMVIDTDAHQGNGYARDKLHFSDSDLFIVDLYNAGTHCTVPVYRASSTDTLCRSDWFCRAGPPAANNHYRARSAVSLEQVDVVDMCSLHCIP